VAGMRKGLGWLIPLSADGGVIATTALTPNYQCASLSISDGICGEQELIHLLPVVLIRIIARNVGVSTCGDLPRPLERGLSRDRFAQDVI